MVSVDITSARLVPAPGADGLLCRLPGAVVWLPGGHGDAGELMSGFLSARSAAELLGSVGPRLVDPTAAPWPPFAIVAARGADIVVVVHGPVEVTAEQDGREVRLYGGDEAGSWLNRLLRGASLLRAGNVTGEEALVDLREGVIRASGFALVAAGERSLKAGAGSAKIADLRPRVEPGHYGEVGPKVVGGASQVAGEPRQQRPAADDVAGYARGARPQVVGDSVTVVDHPVLGDDPTVVEGRQPSSAGASQGAATALPAVLGRLTWDNGEVHQLRGAVLVGRDVASDQAVLAGQLLALVPGGQNDSMSRVHAELWPRGGDVVVTDRGSTNGTFVWDEASRAWQRLVAGQPQELPSGSVLAFGERTATFEGAVATTR